jgi:hypothetical protein
MTKKYEIKELTKKDGSTIYIIYENKNSYTKYGFTWYDKEEVFAGTLEECKEKIKELEEK